MLKIADNFHTFQSEIWFERLICEFVSDCLVVMHSIPQYVFQHSNMRSIQTSCDGRASAYFVILNMSLANFGHLPVLSKSGSPGTPLWGCCYSSDHTVAPMDSVWFFLLCPLLEACIAFVWQGFGSKGCYSSGFSEKLLEVSPMTDRANASQLQPAWPVEGQDDWWHT